MHRSLSSLGILLLLWNHQIIDCVAGEKISKRYPRYSFNFALSKLLWFANGHAQPTDFPLYLNSTLKIIQKVSNMKRNLILKDSSTSSECLLDILSILESLVNGSGMEKYRWIDASGRPTPGISGGAIHWPGSFDLCTGKYPELNPNLTIPISDADFTNASGSYCNLVSDIDVAMEIPNSFPIGINIGMCIPRVCNFSDLLLTLDPMVSKFSLKIDHPASYCHSTPENLSKDNWFWIATTIVSIFSILLGCGSTLDLVMLAQWRFELLNKDVKSRYEEQDTENLLEGPSESVFEEQPSIQTANFGEKATTDNKTGETLTFTGFLQYRSEYLHEKPPVLRWLSVYAVPTNAYKLLYTPRNTVTDEHGNVVDHPLGVLDGIRVLTMAWIIYGHCTVFSVMTANNILLYIQSHVKRWSFQVLLSGTLSVDTFFLMSGLLTSYSVIPQLKRLNSFRKWVQFWLVFVLHRIIRLTPAYLTVIFLYTGFFLHAWDGPLYPQRAELSDIQFCHSHWWVTYLNNLIYSEQMCLPWSWYLSNELQFSIVLAPIFLCLLHWRVQAGLTFAVALIISCFGSTYGLSYAHNFLPGILSLDSFDIIYIKPYTRWGTYAMGLILGWMLRSKSLKLPEKTSALQSILISLFGLAIASLCRISAVYGLYSVTSGSQPPLPNGVSAFYNAIYRPLFILGVSIVIYLCANRYASPVRALLSWSIFVPLSRLTYGVYLLHPIVIMWITLGAQSPVMLDDLFLVTLFCAVFCFSYLGSLVLTLITESPILLIEKKIFQR